MGGIGGNLYLNMLNGTETQSFAKEADISSHLHRNKDLVDLKMGIHDTRFYYQESIQNGQDNLPLQYHTEQTVAGFGAQPGRFYSPTSLSSCHFNNIRSPTRGGTGQTYVPAGGDGFLSQGKDVYPSGAESYSASFQHGYPRAPLYPIPGLQVSGKTQAVLNNYPLWAKFHKYQTEMIITKQGRRMFPFLSFNISALDPTAHYNVYVDVVLADQHHWRYQGGKWVQCGKAEGTMPGNRTYMHPDSPNTGAHWMRQEVSFGKLKLTNNKGSSNNVAQMIVLQSLHKYQPRLHVVEVKEDGSDDPFLSSKAQIFVFPETQFIAVTAYQNADITQLKIDHNPFAKGFRDNYDTLYVQQDSERLTPSPNDGQQLLAGGCYHQQPYLADQYMSPLPQGRFYSRADMSMAGQQGPKDPSSTVSPHGRWYLPSPHPMPPSNCLDFNSYDGDYATGNGLYKPYPHHLQTPGNPTLGYYPESPFSTGGMSVPVSGAWSASSRPSPPYLSHPRPSKPGPPGGPLSWFRSVPTSSSTSPAGANARPPPPPPLAPPPPSVLSTPPLDSLRLALPQDKPKDGCGGGVVPGGTAEDGWLEAPSVKSVDSADSGLYEGGESKKRRVSPYASSTENSPPNRNSELCEKDSGSDVGYYSFFGH
ncbi:LOW QUALITY PROTEIN: T-box transcription factor TBX21 [Alosa sapidissima]|uniref:LOW QUALITY PROTEIN: T-box transcription factor TBX21 n=1 Tax=Alosa sapidissima TaxID=34773 RepID=UPI001C080E7F|nr:LOW QUALITY PROTEIN: T-box transcription factor TBX21 [Alosa sapidissima]